MRSAPAYMAFFVPPEEQKQRICCKNGRNYSMKIRNRRVFATIILALMVCALLATFAFADGEQVSCPDCEGLGSVECATCEGAGAIDAPHESNMYGTFWSLVPPIVAIVLALITKEVFSSLFIGIVVGCLFYANFNIELAVNTMLSSGFIASLADGWNVGILIFLVVLGAVVVLMNRAGGSAAYGRWASEHITSKSGALGATFGLGCIIFVDDYFNCLTVGSVMKPVTDKFKISRAKLAYIIDSTAAPICMIAPISSWAAAVSGVVEGTDGIQLFISAIPYNFYSLLTIAMIIFLCITKLDFGPMKRHEQNAENGDLFSGSEPPYIEESKHSDKGRVFDLVIPILLLISLCILGMVYTGGLFSGESFINAFANCDASVGLSLGSLLALIIIMIYFMCRGVLSFKDCMSSLPEGFKAMVPAILILTFAWTLKATTGLLGAPEYVSELVHGSAKALQLLLPAIIFLVAIGLSFSTGTSWGTFGILIPIVTEVFPVGSPLLIMSISACLAGAVCGDHCSPISDTTIMASAGAQCNHVSHVSTQLPYALVVAAVSFVSYIIAGFVQNAWISLGVALVLMIGVLLIIRAVQNSRTADAVK